MTTLWTHRLLAGFGDATSAEEGGFVEFSILWDGDLANMPGWDQANQSAGYHVPGSNTNIVFLMGQGALTRAFSVLCPTKKAYAQLAALQQYEGTLRVAAAMNELDVAVERDFSGDLVADIPNVVLLELTRARVWIDGAIEAQASFWRSGRR